MTPKYTKGRGGGGQNSPIFKPWRYPRVKRSEDGCDMRKFRSFNHSTCKRVLNRLEAIYLRLAVEKVTVVKFRVDNRGSNGIGCFRIIVRTDAPAVRPSDF